MYGYLLVEAVDQHLHLQLFLQLQLLHGFFVAHFLHLLLLLQLLHCDGITGTGMVFISAMMGFISGTAAHGHDLAAEAHEHDLAAKASGSGSGSGRAEVKTYK